jgi:phenylpyruvate tautomerase PptA (4-oxalocrotonate tautomerase family)
LKKITKSKRDVIGQGTSSLTTITVVVNQVEGDNYVTSSLVLTFINTRMQNLTGNGSIKHPWFGPGNVWSEFPVSSVHESNKATHISIREYLEDRWVTNLNEDRKRFYLIALLNTT